MAMKIKKGDNVIVIAGTEKGKEGKVLSVDTKKNRVIVEGVNMIQKHKKAGQGSQEGGIISQEGSIDISNVMLCVKGQPVRVGFMEVNGKKVRVDKKTGNVVG